MRFLVTLIFGCIALSSGLSQQSDAEKYRAAAESVNQDLREALAELALLREEIAKSKPPLAKETNEIAANLREAKRKADIARTSREAAEAEFEKTEREIKVWRDEKQYLEGLLYDFRKTYEASQSLARIESERELLLQSDLGSRLALVQNSIDHLSRAGKAQVIEGEALNDDGILVPGQFAEAGPVRWFLSADGKHSGLIAASDDLRPRLVAGTEDANNIELLLREKPASPRFDPTLGTAVALTNEGTGLIEHIKQGGFWIYPILILAAFALLAAIIKWIQLVRIREFRPSLVQDIVVALNERNFDAANSTNQSIKHPSSRIMGRGIAILSNDPKVSRDDLEEGLYEKFLAALPSLNRGLPVIAIASATAPLLGLLGTVTGMIETFRLINIFGTGDAKSLASGISEALVTTEFGLIVAIPSLILHALLSRKVQGIKSNMEMTSLAFLNGIEKESEKKAA